MTDESKPETDLNQLDLVSFLVDDRLAAVRDEMFKGIPEEHQTLVAKLLRLSYSCGLIDGNDHEITHEIHKLGFTIKPNKSSKKREERSS